MLDLNWNNSYLVGDALIDSEHQRLFEIARNAKNVVEPSMRKQKIRDEVREIYEYSKTHFQHEEEYMHHIGYPYINEHKQEHQKIIEAMSDFIKKLSLISAVEFEKELAYFIETYMVGHILLKDKRIAIWKRQNEKIKYSAEFKRDYLVGNEQIDEEHKKLFTIAAKFFKEHEDKNVKLQTIKDALKELSEYMKFHFDHEEEFMQTIPFHDFVQRHKKLHETIINDFNRLIQLIPKLDTDAIELELTHFIEVNLIHHIVVEDKKIVEYQEKIYKLDD